jgi:hypothetical protein
MILKISPTSISLSHGNQIQIITFISLLKHNSSTTPKRYEQHDCTVNRHSKRNKWSEAYRDSSC